MEKKKPSAAKKLVPSAGKQLVPKVATKKCDSDSSASYSFSSASGSIEENITKKKVKIPKNKSDKKALTTKKSPPMETKKLSTAKKICTQSFDKESW
jgi:hypothetical protein